MKRTDWAWRRNNTLGGDIRYVALSVLMVCAVSACESGSGADPENAPGSITAITSSTGQVQVNAGASVLLPITVDRTTGFIGTVELTIDGVPSGVTHSFSPSVLSFGQSTSVLKLDLSQGAQPGNHPLIIRASAKSVEPRTVTITLSIPVPDVTISTGNSAVSVALEDTVSIPITMTRTGGGFIDPITFTVRGLVAGVSARFEPSVLTGSAVTSTLKLTADLGAALGASTVQIVTTGIAIGEKSTPLPFTVLDALQPTFRVKPTFTSVQVPFRGGMVEHVIGVPRGGGLTAPVVMAVDGVPANVVATFTPAAVTGASTTMRLTASSSALAGNYPLTVRGVAPGVPERLGQFNFTVSGARITAYPTSVRRGSEESFVLDATRFGSYSAVFTISAVAAPPGFLLDGLPVSLPATVTSTTFGGIRFVVAGSVAPGVYLIALQATDQSGVIATTNLQVTVTN